MAGTGPAPKAPDERRNTSAPRRGEWIDLPPLEEPVLPGLPKGTRWPATTRAAWEAWRYDPVTAMWSRSDIAYALDTIRLHAKMSATTAGEVRLRMDSLGLTPKGKQDRRWRVVEAPPAVESPAERQPARRATRRRAHLTAVK